MDLPTALVLILVLAALVLWMVHPSTGRALDAFGSGFVGYREAGWPIGVQEGEPVRFVFTDPQPADAARSGSSDLDAGGDVVVIELDRPPADVEVSPLR